MEFTTVMMAAILMFFVAILMQGYAIYRLRETTDKWWKIKYVVMVILAGIAEVILAGRFVFHLM
ncbi:MAG: hypothetical protein O0V67_01905 [Methanocorpusculum sp.]|nr:hypothetical protein [Methanocorpusculum sp.]